VSDADLAQAQTILRKAQASEEDQAHALAALLEGRAGLVHLSSAADRWTIYWPDLAGQVVLGSAERFPPQWDIAAALTRTGQRFARLAAAPGDTVAAATAALPAAGLAGSMADGGSAVVDVLDEHFAGATGSFTGLVLEVR
jgi:hypothetical protein